MQTEKIRYPIWNNIKFVPYLFILPNMIVFTIFMIIPIFMNLYYSMVRWGGLGDPVFIGLDNYRHLLFNDPVFWRTVWNTVFFTATSVPIIMGFALMLAILLNQKIRFRGFFRSAIYMPAIIAAVVVGMTFLQLFNPHMGIVNHLLSYIGVSPINWANDPRFAMVMVITGMIWGRTGFTMVIYLAALQGISSEYYEAAKIDGAGAISRFRFITMPLLSYTHMFVFITSVVHSFRTFDQIFVMTRGGPLNATMTMVVYIYETAFARHMFGRASAAGMILLVFMMVFTIVRFKTQREVY